MESECENYSPSKKPAFPCGHCPKMVPGCSDSCRAFLAARDRLVRAQGSCDTCEYLGDDGCTWRPLDEEVDALAARLARFQPRDE